MNVLVTGADGFLGERCAQQLVFTGIVHKFDLPQGDVLDRRALADAARGTSHCLHLAAHKHAPYGEDSPAEVAELNILGTRNVVEQFGPNVVLASTCKAADPMTAYGASKLIAERIVLNAGGRVVRLVNVWGSSGSVGRTWKEIPKEDPIPVVAGCQRMWMTADAAVAILTMALGWPSGRYAPAASPVSMMDVAKAVYPDRSMNLIPPRRGDRIKERLVGEYEWAEAWSKGIVQIHHPADVTYRPARDPEVTGS